MARRISNFARNGSIVVVMSTAAIEASFSRARLPVDRRRRYLRLLLDYLEGVPREVLEPKPEKVEELADLYFDVAGVDKYENAIHIAVAVLLKVDYFLTWDEEHILKRSVETKIRELNDKRGFKTPRFLKPEEFKP